MTRYIELDALLAEIKRRKELVSDPILSGNDLMIGERNAYFNLLPFTNTLEVKELDLEKKEIIDKACWWLNNNRLGVIDDDYIKEFRKAINN